MNNHTRILFVEYLPSDMELAELELRKGGIHFTSQRVDTKSDLIKALNEFRPDIIISDYSMPGFNGMQALKISLKHDHNIPVIMLTGSMKELIAVECMKAGATDYVIKEHITRLPYAVAEALEKKEIKAAGEKADNALRDNEAYFRSLIEHLTDYLLLVNSDGIIKFASPSFSKLIGYTPKEVIGKSAFRFFFPGDLEYINMELRELLAHSEIIREVTFRAVHKNGASIFLRGKARNLLTHSLFDGILLNLQDITEHKRVEEALRESEKSLQEVQRLAQIGSWQWTLATDTVKWSEELYHINGCDPNLSPPGFAEMSSCYTPESWKRLSTVVAEALQSGKSYELDLEIVKPDSTTRHTSSHGEADYDTSGKIVGLHGTVQDITGRKQAEEEIKNMKESLEKLNQHLDEIRENERALISREIHDQLGQSLTALKIDLYWLRGQIARDSEEGAKLNGMIELVTGTIRDVQRISSELRPPILDDLGLAAALEWYCEEFADRTGLQVQMDMDDVQAENMNKNLVIYRVLQESLTNIIRHAGAKKVKIKLCKIKKDIVLIIQDDGIGISPDKIRSSKSLGLLGMFERVKQSGGHMEITTPYKGGTKLRIYIPIK